MIIFLCHPNTEEKTNSIINFAIGLTIYFQFWWSDVHLDPFVLQRPLLHVEPQELVESKFLTHIAPVRRTRSFSNTYSRGDSEPGRQHRSSAVGWHAFICKFRVELKILSNFNFYQLDSISSVTAGPCARLRSRTTSPPEPCTWGAT